MFRIRSSWGVALGVAMVLVALALSVSADMREVAKPVAPLAAPPAPQAQATIALSAGWNLLSLPLAPASTTITQALLSITGSYTQVYAYDAFAPTQPWRSYAPAAPSYANDLSALHERLGFWVQATRAVTLTLSGQSVTSATIPLTTGWNLVGYPCASAQPLTTALQSLAGSYDEVYTTLGGAWRTYILGAPDEANTLTSLIPGQGYWLHVTRPCTWTLLCAPTARPWPDSSARILVFQDQLALHGATEAQVQFAATRYAGTQKMVRADTRWLRTYNPDFLVVHYRLGQALGHSVPNASCQPSTDYISIIEGDDWVREWPGNAAVQENWFFHYNGSRVFQCDWGHYLAALDDPGWRAWWSAEVIRQLQANENDGLFADSYSVANYLGAYNPALPPLDIPFENAWAARMHAFTDYIRAQFAGRWKWIPNIGSYVTTRDPSDYANLDGAMIEGFAEWGEGNYFDLFDWQLQMNRVLALVRADKILIAQTYPIENDVQERLFALGSYLLIKGAHTYVNLETRMEPEWFPEYGINLGAAVDALPTDIDTFLHPSWGVYVRRYVNGIVVVNPDDAARSFGLGATYQRVVPSGGGEVPADGSAPGSLGYQAVTSLNLGAHRAAILLYQQP